MYFVLLRSKRRNSIVNLKKNRVYFTFCDTTYVTLQKAYVLEQIMQWFPRRWCNKHRNT